MTKRSELQDRELYWEAADPGGVLTGVHFINGDAAACEGALAAGCRFVAGYPITPSTEVVERFATRIPTIGGVFIQMEDEIASSIAIQGAVWGGLKAMTVTSGPGFSLMMEHIGLAAMLETPCVFINVQRGGPSTGLPTMPGQADMMQVRWGAHGDYEVIALVPNSPQECFDLTIEAFNLAEEYRVPTFVMMDECIGHMAERVVIPPADQIKVLQRRFTSLPPGEYLPFRPASDLVPWMVKAGMGHRFHLTGLTHDERGYPLMSVETQGNLVSRLVDKIRMNAGQIVRYEEDDCEEAEVVVISYGITSRVVSRAVVLARNQGIKVGSFRPVVVWPFPERRIRKLAGSVRGLVVAELNYGQISLEVERLAGGRCPVVLVPHGGGTVHQPEDIFRAIRDLVK